MILIFKLSTLKNIHIYYLSKIYDKIKLYYAHLNIFMMNNIITKYLLSKLGSILNNETIIFLTICL